MRRKMWQVDAFTDRVFGGNPAAVVPLEAWLPDATMQAIGNENHQSETAFFVPAGPGEYHLRWFTPEIEVDLCGHATLASAWVVFQELEPSLQEVTFHTRSGPLGVRRGSDGRHEMSLPANAVSPLDERQIADDIGRALSVPAPNELYRGKHLLALWRDPAAVHSIRLSDLSAIMKRTDSWALIATAGDGATQPYDFISRFFSVGAGIPEDPVTGSAHCTLVPFWARRLAKKDVRAFQASKRGGELFCRDEGARVRIAGTCVLYLRGEIEI